MSINFRFYNDKDFMKIEEMILESYKWSLPAWGLSRHEFTRGAHIAWGNVCDNWRHTIGIWEENNKIISAVISEAVWNSECFFLFDSLERQNNTKLLESMFHHAETYFSCFKKDYKDNTRHLRLLLTPEYKKVKEMAISRGFKKENDLERLLIMPFDTKEFEIKLPEKYKILDGTETPDFYLSNTHMFSFNYTLPTAETGEIGFSELRKMPNYNPKLDLCIVDEEEKPVGMAIIWYNEKMPYCELEPLGVVWWCRRKGIATALIHEAANRVMKINPKCRGMLGGDQKFYWDLGFEVESTSEIWHWQKKF